MGKFSKDRRDIFYRIAKEQNYRARSSFKLIQIENTFEILKSATSAVDLCAAPGSWSQVLAQRMPKGPNRRIVAVDLQQIAPIDGVTTLKEDITDPSVIPSILRLLGGRKADIVLSDGAPDVSGLDDEDYYIQTELVLSALAVSLKVMKPGATFLAKIFRGKDVHHLARLCRTLFETVRIAKPVASRSTSIEAFILCIGFKKNSDFDLKGKYHELKADEKGTLGDFCSFVSCGDRDGLDSDRNYNLERDLLKKYVYKAPIQRPIDPAYKAYFKERGARKDFD